ncbi:MAG: hypothetical protein AABX53_03555 [Nanoarchaeota archaeon]
MQTHLDFIHNTINRMSNNSFLIKGWAITFISLLFAFAVNGSKIGFLLLSLLPITCFWFLDSYYLRQERLFRKLYDFVRTKKSKEKYCMDTSPFKKEVSFFSAFFSSTVAILYIPIILLNVALQLLIILGII